MSLTSGLAKGWKGFVWMLKILLPISFLTFLLAWSGWIHRLDFILKPVMEVIGLPPMAAIPLIAGLLTGPYGAIAAMAPLPMTVDQMTLLAIFLLISHNLIQEGVIQSKSGFPFFKATLFRLIASITTVMAASWFLGHETATSALADTPAIIQEPFFSMFKTWMAATLILSGKILVIIVALMITLEIMKNYNLIDRITSEEGATTALWLAGPPRPKFSSQIIGRPPLGVRFQVDSYLQQVNGFLWHLRAFLHQKSLPRYELRC